MMQLTLLVPTAAFLGTAAGYLTVRRSAAHQLVLEDQQRLATATSIDKGD